MPLRIAAGRYAEQHPAQLTMALGRVELAAATVERV
jgi:hypothetical protein